VGRQVRSEWRRAVIYAGSVALSVIGHVLGVSAWFMIA
jgi:hypothetical protein